MSRTVICYKTLHLSNQTVAPNLPVFQGIKRCVQYFDIQQRKPIFYRFNYYDGSNVIRLTWSGNKLE